MKSYRLLLVIALGLVGCGGAVSPAQDGGASDGGTDAAPAPDATSPDDSGAGRVLFEIRLTVSGGLLPVANVRACEVSAVPENCVLADANGAVSISLPDDEDVVLSYEAPGVRTFHHAVHTGSPLPGRPRYNMYSMSDETEAYAAIGGLSPTTGEAVLFFESELGREGIPGVRVDVVSPADVRFYGAGADGLPSPTEPVTSDDGAAAAAGLSPGEVVFTATSASGTPCEPWFGGFEAEPLDDGTPAFRIPVTAGFDTRLDLRCP